MLWGSFSAGDRSSPAGWKLYSSPSSSASTRTASLLSASVQDQVTPACACHVSASLICKNPTEKFGPVRKTHLPESRRSSSRSAEPVGGSFGSGLVWSGAGARRPSSSLDRGSSPIMVRTESVNRGATEHAPVQGEIWKTWTIKAEITSDNFTKRH